MSYLKGFSTIIDAKAIVPTDSADNWGSMLHGVLPKKHGDDSDDETNVFIAINEPSLLSDKNHIKNMDVQ
jgi:hypothetical protein